MAKERAPEKGVARIKEEFVIVTGGEEVPPKRPKLDDDGSKQKKKGQFKNRHSKNRLQVDYSTSLCAALMDVPEEAATLPQCKNSNCKFLHDLEKYLEVKPPDIGETCFSFEKKGHCQWGVTCRFGKRHITENGRNKKCPEIMANFMENGQKCVNFINKDVQFKLRKRTYDFSKSMRIVKEVTENMSDAEAGNRKENLEGPQLVDINGLRGIPEPENGVEKPLVCENCCSIPEYHNDGERESDGGSNDCCEIGPCPDEDMIRFRQKEKRRINWKGKLYLSPLTTLGNLPFRRICKEFGADITCAEMTMAPSLLQSYHYEWALIKRHESEDLFGIQVCGNNPSVMTKCAQLLEETVLVDFIDINLGCPIDLVYEKGSGSGLLRRERVLSNIVRSMTRVLNLPLTVKTRTGVYADKNVAHKLMPIYKEAGVSLVTVHGRSREQRYTRTADWSYIDECARAADPVPLFGNGDILSYEDYNTRMSTCRNVAGVMIGRGALYKPWLFTEIKERRDWDISSGERFDIIKKYVNYGLEHWGSDAKGVELTRKFTLEWLSFLYRYIPVGLLERPPQKINERPPKYVGRNDLETLMASPNCSDWVKITEMLLGPVPDGFHFLPKHKANAWDGS